MIDPNDQNFLNRHPIKIKWWDWEYEKIDEYIPLLESGDIDKFIEGAKNENQYK